MSTERFVLSEETNRWGEEYNVLIDTLTGERYYDRGEPEDNSFHRDWSWVPTLLNELYEKGLTK